VTKEMAQKALGYDKTDQSSTDIKKFQDYLFEIICDIAAELEFPLQVHTGLGDLFETSPLYLERLIKRHPKTIFILMHGGYPWMDDLMGLAHNYQNVVIDLCWLPLISSSAAVRVLYELLDVCNMNRICWGCDTHTGEESYGALLVFTDVLAKVLYEKVSEGYFDMKHALICINNIMETNACFWFNLP
jgi:predicted TIM-barrel fold metal-dependent hydrolase